MATPREQFGLVTLPDGRLMALGGANINTGAVLNSTELYDFGTKSWSPGPAMLNERQCGIFQLVGGTKIYAVGGEDSTQAVSTTMEVLDLKTQTWTFAPTASTKQGPWTRESFGAGLIGSKMFFIGGQKDDGDLTTLRGCTYFDTSASEWGKCASMSQARSDFGLAVFGGKMYAMGGFDLAINFPIGGFLDSAEVYDPVKDAWRNVTGAMSMKRGSLQAAPVAGGKILAVGGFWDGPRPHPDPHPTTGGAVALVEVFDPETETFVIGDDLVGGPRVSHASAVHDGTMWVAGGENDDAETIATLEAVQQQTQA